MTSKYGRFGADAIKLLPKVLREVSQKVILIERKTVGRIALGEWTLTRVRRVGRNLTIHNVKTNNI